VDQPHSFLMHPVYPYFSPDFSYAVDDLVGFVVAILPWDSYFTNVLPEGVNGMVVVLHDTCGDHYTYQLDGPVAIFLGEGDLHDTRYDYMEVDTEFNSFIQYNFSDTREHCEYDLRIFPSKMMEDSYTSNKPALYTTVVVLVFIFTAMVFVLYDCLVQRRQDKVMATAKRTNAIVSSLFPSNVRDRILKDAEEQAEQDMLNNKKGFFGAAPKNRLKTFLDEGNVAGAHAFDTKPIADLFPHTTVMFGDIVGFTAWSSVREPSQVFTLLETVYHAFDEIAKRRRVFKVETIGDCYVAVTGLPDPRKDHAVVMARFARDALHKMNDLTKRLEVSLGPDTGDLSMRFGLHSGPVTAGVLRGDKSRFQLFGDTVNTAARIESTGQRNKIHLSKETADLLIAAGKNHWVSARQELVQAKGKGDMQTYWLTMKVQSGASSKSGTTDSSADNDGTKAQVDVDDSKWVEAGLKEKKEVKSASAISDDKAQRLVDWNTDVLARLLKQVVARRNVSHTAPATAAPKLYLDDSGKTVLDEVKAIIHLPEFDAKSASNQENPESIDLGEEAMAQLRDYVSIIATMYRDNPFHNFEHASHVTMSVVKLLSRIVAPDQVANADDSGGMHDLASTLHDHTYGITSDPLTQFACVFAALIHDVDHTGLPNTQLVKEKTALASAYNDKSVAEQNSVDVAWALLMDDSFSAIRRIIYSNGDELKHFRQLVVNSVMATDIMDKDLKELRNSRWDRAFQESAATVPESIRDTVNRKATIVIEHLIQASDVSHTMQHWHIYRKWNERLFQEMYLAYKSGHSDKDPSDFWYKGEMGFFDFYIIPLAKKLKDCGVFGVSSDEYLNYAQKNRQEWERRGQDVVASMIEKFSILYADYDHDSDHEYDGVRLDDIQDEEKTALRSQLARTDTHSDDGITDDADINDEAEAVVETVLE
jgi:class 3 adenylate cyclase